MNDVRWVVVRVTRWPKAFESKIVGIAKTPARAEEILGDQAKTDKVARYAIIEVPEA